jgi:Ca2+-binding RTX toxin-like protein
MRGLMQILVERGRSTRARKHRTPLQPAIQTLETRVVPAVILRDGDIFIRGSGGPDIVHVEATGRGTLRIFESINGVRRELVLPPVSFQGGDIFFTGLGGNDTFTCTVDLRCHLTGGRGNDSLFGGSADDLIDGGPGSDVLQGRGGRDRLRAGADAETDTNFLGGDDGDDILEGNVGRDRLSGGDGNDRLTGHQGDDQLSGGLGDDVYLFGSGRLGTDTFPDHDPGRDRLDFSGMSTSIRIDVGKTTSQLVARGRLALRLRTSTSIDDVTGTRESDVIIGNALANRLVGGRGRDRLDGGLGLDVLDGGIDGQPDVLIGGGFADTFFREMTFVSTPRLRRVNLDHPLDFRPAEGDRLVDGGVLQP